ncbi:LysM peptidoglycan-binding domain-containing protein [Cystobacter fuscus]|uniref:LysM peptidoglycan-binding domain-containing protein n=1 Tax=Cystobacter fuscus TaxID=43 RepID=UPI0037BF4E56
MSSYRIRSGDTLSSIARRYGTTVDALANANNIRDPNKISAGSRLDIPSQRAPATSPRVPPPPPRPPAQAPIPAPRPQHRADTFTPGPQQTPPASAERTWSDPNNPSKTYASRDGVPRFSQGDTDWAGSRLGGTGEVGTRSRDSIQQQGCAITASAMAVSALSGQTITPTQMDSYLDRSGGYSGNSVDFTRVGGAANTQPPITSTRVRGGLTPEGIDQQLDAGRPVLVGVNYRTTNTDKPDHWLTVTGRNSDGSYRAIDPNGGGELTLHRDGNQLVASTAEGARHDYRFSGQGVTFSGGNPVRPNGQDAFANASPEELAPTELAPTELAPTTEAAATTGDNAILGQLQTRGASPRTAGQDRVPEGVEGSHQMAESDRARLERFQDTFQQVGNEYGLPPALLAAIASRESRGGNALNPDGTAKYDPNGYGLMQIDAKHNPELVRGGPYSREHVAAAAGLLRDNLRTIQSEHPDWSPAEQLRGAVAAYNMGTDDVRTVANMDVGSTGGDYSSDVWARAQYLASRGF